MYLVPVREAARLARAPLRTVQLWVAEGRLRSTDERPRRVDPDEVIELCELRSGSGRLPRLDHAG